MSQSANDGRAACRGGRRVLVCPACDPALHGPLAKGGWTTGGAGAPRLLSPRDAWSVCPTLRARRCACHVCEGLFAPVIWLGRGGHFSPHERLQGFSMIPLRTNQAWVTEKRQPLREIEQNSPCGTR